MLFGCMQFQIYLLRKYSKILIDNNRRLRMSNNPRLQAQFQTQRIWLKF